MAASIEGIAGSRKGVGKAASIAAAMTELMNLRIPLIRFLPSVTPDRVRACSRVRKALDRIVYDTAALEGNPLTFKEVNALLGGSPAGNHRASDRKQVLNQAASWIELLRLVEAGSFRCTVDNFKALHALVAREEALLWGKFRDGPVTISGTKYRPPPHEELEQRFEDGMARIMGMEETHAKAMAVFLFAARNQFFFDGNKRTGRLMLNGVLLSAGHAAISIPFPRQREFDEAMLRFYETGDGQEMILFLASCSLDQNLRWEVFPGDALNGGLGGQPDPT